MEKLVLHPQNKEQPAALKAIAKVLKVPFEKTSLKKTAQFFDELRHPQTGSGHPEPLKHNLAGYWPRRINKKID